LRLRFSFSSSLLIFPMKLPLLKTLLLVVALVLPAFAAPKKILVVTVTTGFRHSSIPTAEKILAQLAAESGGTFSVEFVRQPAGEPKKPAQPRPGKDGDKAAAHLSALEKFKEETKTYEAALAQWRPKVAEALRSLSPANLRNYDAVLFANTTGDELPLPDRQGFVDWVASGKAFIGVHAATDTFKTFPGYVAMIGAAFKTHGPQVTVECVNHDQAHAAGAPLAKSWTVFDEIYQMKNFERSKVHGLLSLESLMLSADDVKNRRTTAGDYPVAWCKAHGQGRVFYTSLGHREDMWDPTYTEKDGRKNPPEVARQFQQHLVGGILWALDLAPGSGTPQGGAK